MINTITQQGLQLSYSLAILVITILSHAHGPLIFKGMAFE